MKAIKTILLFLAIGLFTISYLFGFEPQLWLSAGNAYMEDCTFQEYLGGTIQAYGDSLFNKILVVIAYPGAKAGRFYHNFLIGLSQ